ncbi:hypothetical protein TARUN_306 [Trichoderma arundinaceum]|uniref:CN hydrolase domain-containing protein n=1 Tax=Trichoderma arundinaceum TaxID=490622 RepID=A0A395P0L1_TRIAR|nr:hypothetical protein TARUN_306 [Trichoderma arundinaceum]
MRIGCLQFAPQVGDVDNNLNRADAVLSKANPEDLDVLVLPELAFSGYNFKSLQDISPFLEPSGSGITSLWARTMALKYNCTVLVGYPEKVDVSPNWPTGPEYYNSAIVVNGDGETIANYRKSFLYYTDESWALEGNRGFYDGYIPGLGNTSIGICMDINPYKFEAPWHAFEFAFHILEVESNLVIISMAWMTREDRRHFSRMPNEPDMNTLTYWVTRLEPLIRSNNDDEIIVVFCNRTGVEDEATYAGTSAVIGIQEGEVKVYGLLGRGEKELLVVDTTYPPYAKMVYRPDVGTLSKNTGEEQRPTASDNGTSVASGRSYAHLNTISPYGKPRHSITLPDEQAMHSEPPISAGQAAGHDQLSSLLPTAGAQQISSLGLSSSSSMSLSPKQSIQLSPSQPNGQSQPKSTIKQSTKRRAPSISIPPLIESLDRNQAIESSDTGGNGIPTPSAPSPTPMAVRPRLIIPQSPSMLSSQQHPEDHLLCATSITSAKSIQSIKSDESEASVQTIRSNPRPPEDSTPYPDSGLPLSGYPSNSFGFRGRIYGGNVTISHETDSFSPTTPFDDISPASPRWFWRPHDSIFRSPNSGAGWTPSTPIGRKPEPFPWSAIKNSTPLPSQTKEGEDEGNIVGLQDAGSKYSQSPRSNTSSNRTGKSKSSEAKTSQHKPHNEKHPSRPSSPKSRNASRSGVRGRSDSSLSQKNIPTAVSQHIEQISQRAESRNRHDAESNRATTVAERLLPLNLNDGHHNNRSNSGMDHLIPIAASPSLLVPGPRANIPTPVAIDYYRHSTSRIAPQNVHSQQLESRLEASVYDNQDADHQQIIDDTHVRPTTFPINRDTPKKSSRSVSRGRQPKRMDTSSNAATVDPRAERATSADSIINGVLHTRVGKRHSYDKGSQCPSHDRGSHVECLHSQSVQNESEFERVEVVSCPSCPIHGQQSASTNDSSKRSSDPTGQRRHLTRDAASGAQPDLKDDVFLERIGMKKAEAIPTLNQEASTIDILTGASNHSTDSATHKRAAGNGSALLKDTAQATTSSKSEQTSTKPKFNPTTPRAMIFDHNHIYVETLSNPELGFQEQSSSWFTVEKKVHNTEAGSVTTNRTF